MEDLNVSSVQATDAAVAEPKRTIWHKLFGSVPGDGEMQPKEGICYSLCGFGQNLICTVIGSYLTVFMTDAIGYSAIAVALLMLFARIYDALNDPIMGSIVDRTRTKWGKCRPYLKWMALPIAGMTILCFLPVYGSDWGSFAAISIVYIIWGMVYTVADVPYWGLSTAMSNDTYRRGNLLTIARLLCTAGAGLVTIIVPQITSNMTADAAEQVKAYQTLITAIHQSGFNLDENALSSLGSIQAYVAQLINSNQGAGVASILAALAGVTALKNPLYTGAIVTGADLQNAIDATRGDMQNELSWIYFVIAIVCVVVAVPLFYLGFKNTRERNQTMEKPPSLKHNLQLLFKNKPLMLIVISGVLGAARMVFTYTGGLYFAKYVLADVNFLGMQGEGLYTLITLAVVPGGLVASLMVPYLTKKIGKKQSYIWSHIVGGIALLIAFIIGMAIDKGNYTSTATLVIAFIALVIAGVPSGLSNIVSYAMIGDTVEYLELKTGERAEGICFAMQTFINKIGMAVGAFIGVLGYYMAGVTANNPGALDSDGKDVMWIMLMLVAAISFIAAAIPIFFYKFNEKEQVEAAAEIKRRKEAAAGEITVTDTVETVENGDTVETVETIEITEVEETATTPEEDDDKE